MELMQNKALLLDDIYVQGSIDEDGDYYLIDLYPNTPGPVLRVQKNLVKFELTENTISIFGGSKKKMADIWIKKDATAILMQPIKVSDFLDAQKEGDVEIFRRCNDFKKTSCKIAFPVIYPQVKEALKIAKDRGIIVSHRQCKDYAGNTGKLVELLTSGLGFDPVTANIIGAIAGSCGKCVCDDVF